MNNLVVNIHCGFSLKFLTGMLSMSIIIFIHEIKKNPIRILSKAITMQKYVLVYLLVY